MEKLRLISKSKTPSKIPDNPGIYIFWQENIPIYIGKAINLKNRIKSYFNINLAIKTKKMVSEAAELSFIKVTSELEALLLEASLIKKYQPKYNFISKDDKHPLYIKITKEKFPRVITVRKNDKEDRIAIFGPFPSSDKVYSVLKNLRRIFPYATHKPGRRICIYNQIGLCNPCPNDPKTDRASYIKNIRHIKAVLSGKSKTVIGNLTKEMTALSNKQKYEEADLLKKQIENLNYLTQVPMSLKSLWDNPNLTEDIRDTEINELGQILKIPDLKRIECFDVSHISGYFSTASMVTFISGEPDKNLYRRFKIKSFSGNNDTKALCEIAKRRRKNLGSWGKPDLILVDGGLGQVNSFKAEFKGLNIPIVGIAKREERLVFTSALSFKLNNGPAKNLVQRIRDESHRFAQKYHNLLFKKALY